MGQIASYGNLRKHCVDLRGGDQGSDSPFGYGYTGPLPQLPVKSIRLPKLGKPHELAPYPGLQGPDERPRVEQHAQKGPTCWYYALKMIRRPVGKHADAQDTPERRAERVVSEGRKRLTELGKGLQEHLSYIETKRDLFGLIGPLNVEKFRKDPAFSKMMWQDMLSAFASQRKYQTFYHFTQAVPEENEAGVLCDMIRCLGKDVEEEVAQAQRKDPKIALRLAGARFKDLSSTNQKWIAHFLAIRAAAEGYNLRLSTWSPHQNIDALIRELEAHGPVAIGGHFGERYYVFPSRKIGRQIEGREVYGWRPGTPRRDENVANHMVVVVGAEKIEGKQLVYFLDPNFPSDPEAPENQRIFAISYANLRRHITNRCGRKFALDTKAPSPFGWGYTGSA